MSVYRVTLLQADHGDCIVVEYGAARAEHRILIDGGTPGTWDRLKQVLLSLPEAQRRFELLVVTHVDADHIGGALKLFDGSVDGLTFDEIWFNGYRHLSGLEEQGPVQGERLTTQLWPLLSRWNKSFGGKAVIVPDQGDLPTFVLRGGMSLTLLSPTASKLDRLRPEWVKACAEAGLDPQQEAPTHPEGLEPMGPIDVDALASAPYKEDATRPNGSSIAFIAAFGGRSVMFCADAHPAVLSASIRRLPGGKATVDALKVPHHGSKNNVSRELLDLVETSRFLVSTNGSHFKHPDREAIARIVQKRIAGCELRFNYDSAYTRSWDSETLKGQWAYATVFPDDEAAGDVLDF